MVVACVLLVAAFSDSPEGADLGRLLVGAVWALVVLTFVVYAAGAGLGFW